MFESSLHENHWAEHFTYIISLSRHKSPGAGIIIPFSQIRKQNLSDIK